MKVLVLKASPNKAGNTATMADRFVEGLNVVGHAEVTTFHLNDLNLRPCQGCNGCFQPPYTGCVLDDDFNTVYPVFRDADVIVFAAPIYWWHLCAQMKTFIDRMHPMLTFDRSHCLPTKDLVLITAYLAEDPYGVELAIRMLESITGWAGMGFHIVRFHSEAGPVQQDEAKLAEARDLGRSFADWRRPELSAGCPVDGCGFLFRSVEHAAKHLVMAAGGEHLRWKADNLSGIHTLQNTDKLTAETLRILERMNGVRQEPSR
ncbi:flavodoxin family protein [Candidatus Bipolaricaulota bacterium]|nr:flavodoxin family protein [Candidatus Bipolaricaulota bacterium]